MESRIKKWGNSLGIRIPSTVVAELGLRPDEPVELSVQNDSIVITKSRHYSLDELLARVTPANLHGEIPTGARVGAEEW